jgi:hypothetical protein
MVDILIACVDGLTGFPQAIEAVFPERKSIWRDNWGLTFPHILNILRRFAGLFTPQMP